MDIKLKTSLSLEDHDLLLLICRTVATGVIRTNTRSVGKHSSLRGPRALTELICMAKI